MEAERPLSADQENQWQELSRHIEWSGRFSLMVLFVEDALLAESFKQRLQSQLQGRFSALYVLRPADPATLSQTIFDGLGRDLLPHAVVPCWLELHLHRTDQWQRALDNFFARFNERRDLIRRDYPRPFIILLPLAYKSRLREIAPDLWSVRSHTDELRSAIITPPHINHITATQTLKPSEQALSSPEIREWQRVKDTDIADSELLLVAGNAFNAALALGHWPLAETLAGQLVTLCHKLIADEGENAWTLRNLSVALEKQGDIEQALGRYDAARQAYGESLAIRRELKASQGTTAQVLRDLSISLDRVADIDKALGRYEAALTGYGESLAIRRGLKASQGGTPQVLRDLSVSLTKMADIDTALGRYEAALTGYGESLAIFRELKASQGATPQVLRDLSVSLEKVADIDTALGRYEAALTGYGESLAIRRELKTGQGGTPQVLDDLSISLQKLADCENSLRHYGRALAAYRECLPLLEQLQAALAVDRYSARVAEIKAKISALEQREVKL